MRYHVVQHLEASIAEIEDAVTDPAFLASLEALPKLGRPDLLDQQRDGTTVRQRVRYRFVGEVSSAVRKVVDPSRLSWVEESVVDTTTHRTRFSIVPDEYRSLLEADGVITLTVDGAGTCRRAEGEVRVRVPILGKRVEQAIVTGMTEHAETEARLIDEWVARRRPGAAEPPPD